MARNNRSVGKPDAEWAQEQIPDLNIENGAPQVIPPSITTESSPVASLSAVSKDAEMETKPSVINSPSGLKTPALLTAQKTDATPDFKSEPKVVADSQEVTSVKPSSDDYPTTGLPSLQPANKIAQAHDESGATGPQYPTTNYPASWR